MENDTLKKDRIALPISIRENVGTFHRWSGWKEADRCANVLLGVAIRAQLEPFLSTGRICVPPRAHRLHRGLYNNIGGPVMTSGRANPAPLALPLLLSRAPTTTAGSNQSVTSERRCSESPPPFFHFSQLVFSSRPFAAEKKPKKPHSAPAGPPPPSGRPPSSAANPDFGYI